MCIVSAVMDQWNPHIPRPVQPWTYPPLAPTPTVIPLTVGPGTIQMQPPSVAEDGTPNAIVRELIESLRKAIEAAETLDRLTGQPDCADPEKAKLLDRVDVLESRLDAIDAVENEAPKTVPIKAQIHIDGRKLAETVASVNSRLVRGNL